MKKLPIFLLAFAALAGCSDPKENCKDKDSCMNNKDCRCYCSKKGDFRDKKADDAPVFVENDTNGVFCYCKQWDLDNYPKAKMDNMNMKKDTDMDSDQQ